jgi:hypothetical protein
MKKPMHTNEDEEYLTEVIETLETNLNNLQESYNIIEVHGDFGNIHGVPPEKIESMRKRWEPHV